jgi:HlyD family secretion protein
MTKVRRKHLRRASTLLALLALVSLGIYAGRRALTRALVSATAELAPLTVRLEPRDFALNIAAKGELQSVESITIAVPPVPAQRLRVASVVPEGRAVNKGDLLVEFDPTELDLQVLEHNSSLDMANQKINKGELARDVERTDIVKDKKLAEMELEKISEFLPQDEQIYSRRQIIEGRLDKSYAEKRIVFADARLGLKGKVYSLDEAILMLERQKATQSLTQAKTALSSLKLLSPSSGVIAPNEQGFWFGGSYPMPGRVVWIGMKLFSLVNPDKMEARVYVLEKDAGELRAEQPVTVTLDPFPQVEFAGKVKSIEKVARALERDSPVKYFQAVVSLDRTDPKLMRPGVKLKATVRASDLKSVIVVPRSAIAQKDAGFVAYVERGVNQYEPVAVKLGAGDVAQVVVAEGLQAGQVIALNPPDVRRGDAKKAE